MVVAREQAHAASQHIFRKGQQAAIFVESQIVRFSIAGDFSVLKNFRSILTVAM